MRKPSSTVFFYLGKDERLIGQKLKDYVKFMLLRFPHEQDSAYIREWATRFRNDSEWFHADGQSKKALLKVNHKKYVRYEKLNFGGVFG